MLKFSINFIQTQTQYKPKSFVLLCAVQLSSLKISPSGFDFERSGLLRIFKDRDSLERLEPLDEEV